MTGQERLFLAVGGADPELIARSERKRRRSWLGYGLAAAACLALVFVYVLPLRTGSSTGASCTIAATPNTPDNQDPSGGQFSLPEQGGEIGTLRLLSYTPESQDSAVDFLIYVNEERFAISEEEGRYSIRNIDALPEGFPKCGLDIIHLSGTTPDQAKQETEAALKEHYSEIFSEELAVTLPGSLYLRASAGLEWDSEQVEFWFAGDGQGGVFVLASRFFLEAEEGLGACFRDMASSFRVVNRNETVPDWMRGLYTAADRLFPALFANDLSAVSDLLTEESDTDAYGENVRPDVTVVSVDYAVDNDRDPAKATVSVKHRLNLVEGDSFNYLTMELARRDGSWYLEWSGVEK